MRLHGVLLLLLASVLPRTPCSAQESNDTGRQAPANRGVYLDKQGVVRWSDDRQEVTLFGANYVVHTASDYRAAGYVHADRKKMIDEDMAQFARMGWDGIRLTFWGDWESADSAGNLIANDHLDLLDYLVARARERGIYMLFSPIQLYNAKWPDALADTTAPGFGRYYSREMMGTDPAAIRAQVNYLQQILNHVNPYTHVALKNEPAIVFIELVNEPVHHPKDLAGSIRYINTLTDAVRSTGCSKLVFYNVSQDFRIGEAIRRSRAQGVTFGWYPTGLNSGHELEGNYLRGVDAYPDMLRPELAGMPRIVYEFDSPDLRNGTMYPAMARTFRAVGTQFAAMFSYDMLATASRNLGWQTHYLNLVYTPRKAMSAIIAAEAMHRLPRMRAYGGYPENLRFGDFRVSPEENLGELVARDAFLYAGSTHSVPPDPAGLRRIAGYGSSSTVTYGGAGIYFLDRVSPGMWRLEVYPDAVPVRDPFEPPSPDKIVTRAITRPWPMTINLPGLGQSFSIQPVSGGNGDTQYASSGNFTVMPGVYVLNATGPVDPATLPAYIGHLGFTEYHAPPVDTLSLSVLPLNAPEYVAGHDAGIMVRVADQAAPDSVKLYSRLLAGDWYHGYSMQPSGEYHFVATIPAADMKSGPHEYVVTVFQRDSAVTFPDGLHQQPWDWNFDGRNTWHFMVVDPRVPLMLFDPGPDTRRLTWSRIGDAGRSGLFQLSASPSTGRPTLRVSRPMNDRGEGPADYTASLIIGGRMRPRADAMREASQVHLRLRGLGARQKLHVTLMEDDGTSWTTAVTIDSTWSEQLVPISAFTLGRGVLLPQGFPGEWNYWVGPASGRGGPGDRLRLDHVERLQLSLRREQGEAIVPGGYGVEIESVTLEF